VAPKVPVRITTAANDGTRGDEIKRLFGLMKSNQMATPRNFADTAALAIKTGSQRHLGDGSRDGRGVGTLKIFG
jgi:hypothetical protein